MLLTLLGLDGMGLDIHDDVHGKTFIKVFTIPYKTHSRDALDSKELHATVYIYMITGIAWLGVENWLLMVRNPCKN